MTLKIKTIKSPILFYIVASDRFESLAGFSHFWVYSDSDNKLLVRWVIAIGLEIKGPINSCKAVLK